MARNKLRFITLLLAACLLFSVMGVSAAAEDIVIEKVYARSEKEAVVMRTPGEIAFTTVTEGASVSSVTWTDSNGAVLGANDAFKQEVYTLVVTLTASDGYVFGSAARGYLYGKTCDIAVSADGKTVQLRTKIEPPIWSPIIVKQPLSDPAVDPGQRVSYVSTANFAAAYQWYLVSPDGSEQLDLPAARDRFPGVIITDTGVSLIIDNVRAEMNGWYAMCRFYESTHTYFSDSQKAEIKVNVPAPTPEPTPEATPVPTSQPHAWQSNEGGHWHESADGTISDLAEHSFVWSAADEKGEETGVCSVCGYTASRVSEAIARQELKGKLLIGLGVSVAVLMMLSLAAPKKKKKRAR